MEAALKKEADTYFSTTTSFEQLHTKAWSSSKLLHFYILSLAKYLCSNELLPKIIALHESATINWHNLLNAIWSYSLSLSETGSTYAALANFVGEIDRRNIVDRNMLMRTLPEQIIDLAGLAKKQALDKKAQKAYTKFYYDQNKHNLMRQNNEGFAKLTLLLASIRETDCPEKVWDRILSLIGNFDLDPDRVLDLIIQASTRKKCPNLIINLLKKFKPQSISTLIGNRIIRDNTVEVSQKIVYAGPVQSFMTSTPHQLFKEFGFIVHPKIIEITCQLIKSNVITLQSIFPFLSPNDAILERVQAERLDNGKQKVMKSFKMILQEVEETERIKRISEDNLKFMGQMLYSSKLALITGLVRANDWKNFKIMWEIYKDKVDLLLYQNLMLALMDQMQWIIEPLYEKISLKKYFGKVKNCCPQFPYDKNISNTPHLAQLSQCHDLLKDKLQHFSYVFNIVGQYIGFNSKLYIKLCRLFKKIKKEPQIFIKKGNQNQMNEQSDLQNFADLEIIKHRIMNFIRDYMVPGISYQHQNPALSNEIFALLEDFDYRFRYSCYMKTYKEEMVANPYLANVFQRIKNKQNVVINNLSKDNKKTFAKKMAKMTHNHALQVFYWIWKRLLLEDYQKVVPEVVSALTGCCRLTLQMSMFVTLHSFNEPKQSPMNFRTGQQAAWFKNMITYTSLFYRKYLEIDIRPVFDYIVMKIGQPVRELEDNQQLPGALLNLLHGLLNKLFGSFMIQQLNKTKYEMICAGPRMQFEAMYISSEIKAAKKSKVMLQKFFWDQSVDQHHGQSLALNMLILLTQKRGEMIQKSYITDIKLIGDIYDDYTLVIMQLIRVLIYQSSDYTQYAKLLPQNSLDILVNTYRMPLQIAFEIFRPSCKHIALMENEEWSNFVDQIEVVIKKFAELDDKYISGSFVQKKLKEYLEKNYSKMIQYMGKGFIATFWMLTLDSIYFPQKIYSDKIDQLKKTIEQNMPSKRDKNDRELEKAKTLYERLTKQQEQQKKKMRDTMGELNKSRFIVQPFKSSDKMAIKNFAGAFVQICLLPRMLLDPSEALYCTKFTLEVIKHNQLSSTKTMKLLTYITEYVMNYLPCATKRQSQFCLAIFFSQILGIFTNWNDSTKLRQDMKRSLGIQENLLKDNYNKMKQYILKVFERVGNLIMGIKQDPYIIKNGLYLLQQVETIPGYQQQCVDLQEYMLKLKEQYTSQDMQTILDRQLTILGNIKKSEVLPERVEEVKKKATLTPSGSISKQQVSGNAHVVDKNPVSSGNTPLKVVNKPLVNQNAAASPLPQNPQVKNVPSLQIKNIVQKIQPEKMDVEAPSKGQKEEGNGRVDKQENNAKETAKKDEDEKIPLVSQSRPKTVKQLRDQNIKKSAQANAQKMSQQLAQNNLKSKINSQADPQKSSDKSQKKPLEDEKKPDSQEKIVPPVSKHQRKNNSFHEQKQDPKVETYPKNYRQDQWKKQNQVREREGWRKSKEKDSYREKQKDNWRERSSQKNRDKEKTIQIDVRVNKASPIMEVEETIKTVREIKQGRRKDDQSINPEQNRSPILEKGSKVEVYPSSQEGSKVEWRKNQKLDKYNKDRSQSYRREYRKDDKDQRKDYKRKEDYHRRDEHRRDSKDRNRRQDKQERNKRQDKYDRDRRRDSKDRSRDRDRHYRK